MTNDQTVTQALEPCPFCGGEGLSHRVARGWRVSCKNCDAQPRPGLPPKTEAEAITAWNTRTAHSSEGRDAIIERCARIADGWNRGRDDRVTETSIAAAIRDLSGEGRSNGAGEDALPDLPWLSGPDADQGRSALESALAKRTSMSTVAGGGQRPHVEIRFSELADAHALTDAILNRSSALNARQSGEGEREKFLTAYVSEDSKIIGIEHDTDADWHKVHDAHIALWNRLEERIREREKCPRKPALRATDDAGRNFID